MKKYLFNLFRKGKEDVLQETVTEKMLQVHLNRKESLEKF